MKKILGISSIFIVVGLIICFVVGFLSPVPVLISKKSEIVYKVLTSFGYFIKVFPGMIFTGYLISCSVHFGHNPEGSLERFSKAMMERFKNVIIIAVIFTALLTFGNEFFGVMIKQKKNNIENRSSIVNEYIRVGKNLFESRYYERSMYYAKAALKLDPTSKAASELLDNADLELNRINNSDYRFKLYESVDKELNTLDKVNIDPQQIYDVYQCYTIAMNAFENEEWFNAHYYAEMGLQLASPKDPNLKALQVLSTNSWNNLTQLHKLSKSEDQLIFEKKYQGYLALVQKDDLKAYYIFRELFLTSRELQRDPDVKFYLDVAENRLQNKYFFIDETIELDSFENANDVYFALTYKDGSKDIIYFKGLKNVGHTGKSIQYVRELTVQSLEKNGELFRTLTVPYAKILPVDIKSMNSTTKTLMGIDESIDSVPYIMLNSVERDRPGIEIKPSYTYTSGEVTSSPDYLLLPMPFKDFLLMESSIGNPDLVNIGDIYKQVNIADKYGFSSEVFGQTLFDRIFYPIFLMIFLILISIVGWNNRVGNNQFFKMSWLLAFPFIFVIVTAMYQLGLKCFQFLNYTILGSIDSIGVSMIAAAVMYIVFMIIASVRFLSLRSRT